MMRRPSFEAAELGLTFYLATLHLDDPPFVAIPVYPIRLFCHAQIYVNTNSGIESPKDLIGKRIGEFFLYGHDAGIWSKGILSDHYGVPVDSYSNFIGGVEHPTPPLGWYPRKAPAHLRFSISAPTPRSTRCWTPAKSTRCSPHWCRGRCGASRTTCGGCFRISKRRNATTFERPASSRSSTSSPSARISTRQHPWVARSLYKAFTKSRDRAYAMYKHQAANMHRMFMIPWITQHCLEMQELLGDDWFPYGVKRNHKALDTFCRYYQEQGLTDAAVHAGGIVRAGDA